jgi:hypothetical protein
MDSATALSYGPFFWKYPHPKDFPYSSGEVLNPREDMDSFTWMICFLYSEMQSMIWSGFKHGHLVAGC